MKIHFIRDCFIRKKNHVLIIFCYEITLQLMQVISQLQQETITGIHDQISNKLNIFFILSNVLTLFSNYLIFSFEEY